MDSAGDRAAKVAAAKAAADKAAADEAERQRQAAMMQQEKDKAYKKAGGERRGCVVRVRGEGGAAPGCYVPWEEQEDRAGIVLNVLGGHRPPPQN